MEERVTALARGQEMLAALSARDLAGFDATFDPGAVIVDHRPLSWGAIDLDRFREVFVAVFEMSSDVAWRLVEDLGSTPVISRALIQMRGTRDGGPFESAFLGLLVLQGGVITRVETFGVDDRATLDARFADLGGDVEDEDRAPS